MYLGTSFLDYFQVILCIMWAPSILLILILGLVQAKPLSLNARELSLDGRELSLDARSVLHKRQGSCVSISRPANNPSINNIGQIDITSVVNGGPGMTWDLNNLVRVHVSREVDGSLSFDWTNTGSANRLICYTGFGADTSLSSIRVRASEMV
ncbi:hypothetical protein BM1_08312 [Bipolaris maydis]|nr:hypothetical protein BM1_08312 [Bipolaris maydis]